MGVGEHTTTCLAPLVSATYRFWGVISSGCRTTETSASSPLRSNVLPTERLAIGRARCLLRSRALNGCTQKVGSTSHHRLHCRPAAVQNLRSVYTCPVLLSERIDHTERLPQCWRCYEIDRRSLGRGRRRSGPSCTQRLHARSQVCCTYPRHYAGSKLHKLCQSIGTLQVKVPGEVDEISQVDGFYGHGTGCLARELMATLHVDGVPR
jgi:hypothetical protein